MFRYAGSDGELGDAFNPNGATNHIAGVRNAAGNVVGLMPHPEHAVDPDVGPTGGQSAVRLPVRGHARGGDRVSEPLHRQLGLQDDEYERIVATLGREPNRAELAMYSVMWSEHCSYKSSKIHLQTLPTEGSRGARRPGPGRGRGGHRRWRRGRVQDGVALAPERDRAVPGRGDRRRRDRARHHLDGRAAGGAARPADVRPADRAAEPMALRRRGRRDRRLRQLHRRADGRRRDPLRRRALVQPVRQRDVRRASRRPTSS